MRLLSFIAKLAFFCNVFFVACLLVRYAGISLSQSLAGFVIIMGWILSVIFNMVFATILLVFILQRKRPAIHWLLSSFNMLCLPLQIAFIFLLNK